MRPFILAIILAVALIPDRASAQEGCPSSVQPTSYGWIVKRNTTPTLQITVHYTGSAGAMTTLPEAPLASIKDGSTLYMADYGADEVSLQASDGHTLLLECRFPKTSEVDESVSKSGSLLAVLFMRFVLFFFSYTLMDRGDVEQILGRLELIMAVVIHVAIFASGVPFYWHIGLHGTFIVLTFQNDMWSEAVKFLHGLFKH